MNRLLVVGAMVGARFFAAADVVAGVVAGLGAAFVGVSFAQALWA